MMATPCLYVSLNIFVMAEYPKYPKYPRKGQAQTRTTFELEGLIGHILFRAVELSENIQPAIFPQKIATISLIPVSNIASLLP